MLLNDEKSLRALKLLGRVHVGVGVNFYFTFFKFRLRRMDRVLLGVALCYSR